MTCRVRSAGEFLLTDTARKGPLTGMRSLVIIEAVFPAEAFRAESASVRFFGNMQFLVSVQVPFLREAPQTHTAAKGSLVGVREHVAVRNEEFWGNTVPKQCPFTIHFFTHNPHSLLVVALWTGAAGVRLLRDPQCLFAAGTLTLMPGVWTADAG